LLPMSRNWLTKPSKKFEPCRTCCIRRYWTKWDLLAPLSGLSTGSPSAAELT
jgi:hypothetical protein